MKIRVLRWHEGTWRTQQNEPFDGNEPNTFYISPIVFIVLAIYPIGLMAVVAWNLSLN